MNSKCTQASTTGKLLRNREQVKKAGLRSEISEETNSVMFPVIDDLLKGLCDGRALLGVLMFYEPNVINIEGRLSYVIFSFGVREEKCALY